MSRFEYLSVLLSIVIGLGLSEVASAWGRMLRGRARIRFYPLHAFWSVFVVLMMIQFWWGFWEYREVGDWTFLRLMAVVLEALVLVIAALVLTPDEPIAAALDLRQHFYANSKLFFALGGAVIAQLAIVDFVVGRQPFWHAENAIRSIGFALAAVAAWSADERLHGALALLAGVLFFVFVAVTFTR